MADAVSDKDRDRFEQTLLAALLLIWKGRARESLDRLGLIDQEVEIPPEVTARMETVARARAQLVQTGINQRLAGHNGSDYEQALREIEAHNTKWLEPFLISTASHDALVETYRTTPDPNDSSKSAAEGTLWAWTQYTDFPDECEEASGASPAPLDDLLAITGGPPAVHDRCRCSLGPA